MGARDVAEGACVMGKALQAKLADIRDRNPYQLAGDADCSSPDSWESPGAVLLLQVAREVCDEVDAWVADGEDLDELSGRGVASDRWSEIADGAPDVYTHARWLEFVDLGAWAEDLSEQGHMDDVTEGAAVALSLIAARLCDVLWQEILEAAAEDAEADAED
jgi:hypothetical protein